MTGHVARLNTQAQLAHQGARVREQAQHAPRPARLRFTAKTSGIGETRRKIVFGAFALEEPSFTWGVQALGTIGSGQMPICTAIVLSYDRNEQGLYIGANMGFVVSSLNTGLKLQFSLTFEAATMRSTAGVGTGATASGTSLGTIYKA